MTPSDRSEGESLLSLVKFIFSLRLELISFKLKLFIFFITGIFKPNLESTAIPILWSLLIINSPLSLYFIIDNELINEEIKNQFKEIASKINNKTLKFNKESKENGDLYGTIKPKEVSNAFKSSLNIEINPSQIDLRQEIKQIGKYKININLHAEVTASVNLQVDKIDSI